MKYRIRDSQFECRYFSDNAIFNNKKEILEQLADYHDIDYTGVKNDGKDTPYKDIWEFLNTLKDDEARLNWILDYGEWEIEEVEEEDFREEIINSLISDYTEYLYDFSSSELQLIREANVFTLREAKKEEIKEKV